MPYALSLLAPPPSPSSSRMPPSLDEYDGNSSCSSSTDSSVTVKSLRTAPARTRPSSQRASPTPTVPPVFLLPSATSSPVPSRSASPVPTHYASHGASSSYTSDADSEPSSPLLGVDTARHAPWWNDDTQRWWLMGRHSDEPRRRRRLLRRESRFGIRTLKHRLRSLFRHPLFPKQPTTIIFTFLVFTVIAILITLLLMHILNPDKAPLPWRTYCSLPVTSTVPPSPTLSSRDEQLTMQVPRGFDPASPNESLVSNPFPPPNFNDLPPAGLFLGVFTTDSAVERRMLIRSTWASHVHSRSGAVKGDNGNGTSRTIVRFVLGKPRSGWERRIQLESETYNDIVQLPIVENMNSGKTHAFFSWAAKNAWVPPPAQPHQSQWFSYANHTAIPPPLAPHDPPSDPWTSNRGWVRPDYVVKSDDDSFVMLAELEARLRVELDNAMRDTVAQYTTPQRVLDYDNHENPASMYVFSDSHHPPQVVSQAPVQSDTWFSRDAIASSNFTDAPSPRTDPLVYWGYLVKNRFMAGELYAFSWSLVNWVATEPALKSMTRGAEDKQTAKWMRLHPRANDIRWARERCWIYDHPRAGTVYSHGFLFPSEATRVRRSILSLLRPVQGLRSPSASTSVSSPSSTSTLPGGGESSDTLTYELPSPLLATTPSYSYSSVSQFGMHYTFPLSSLTPPQSIEALVEGSAMSGLFEGGPETALQAWDKREGRRKRYEGERVGGTVVVHFIKKNEWFMETALALLGGEEIHEGEEGWKAEGKIAAAGTTAGTGVAEEDGDRKGLATRAQLRRRRR